MLSRKFRLFAGVFLVKGASRSTICDTQRTNIKFIPNTMCDIVVGFEGQSLGEILNSFSDDQQTVILEYFEFLVNNDYGFYCDDFNRFPSMDLQWDTPHQITNGIIDFDKDSNHDLEKIFREYSNLGCMHLELRFYDEVDIDFIANSLSLLENSRIGAVDFIIKFSECSSEQVLLDVFHNFPRLISIFIHSSPYNKSVSVRSGTMLKYFVEEINSSSHCGNISPEYFTVSQDSFLESLHFNSCLNRKISIDIKGEIRNCPSMKTSFGNIDNTSLIEVIGLPKLKKLWSINKDSIEVCKDCEFRYICTDCRAFLGEDDSLAKPKKCSYNPYKMIWED